ncbi:MAG: nicotinate (nicotinamide) nucleotide adenylyltransferase [Bacteroidetes bacterium RBG_13_42_15]|nr:MAG: nicotinate (nicotinamide) nucleotide adenylyltransferase [Bacteroidetes bacterium RBG_13_42_15]HJX70294.1 nicotinate-nucleotide adenylyltransferase [Bacteroidales bacterium]
MRTGLFGGTFDPIHMGHLVIAETVLSEYPLDRVCFLPAFQPPHKNSGLISAPELRLEMARLAIRNNVRFSVIDYEIRKGGVSYTIDTVLHLKKNEMKNNELFLLIGSDSLLDIHTWKNPEYLVDEIKILVFDRPGFNINTVSRTLWDKVTRVNTPLISISSTEIRNRVHQGKSITYWVPEKVESYINKHGLYRK